MRRGLFALALMLVACASCVDIPPDPLQLDRGMLTVNNHTGEDWKDVEIWINQYFRVTAPTIAARSRFQVPLDSFVSGYSQRFDIHKSVINDLRLTAKQPDGTPVLIRKHSSPGLAVLGGKQ